MTEQIIRKDRASTIRNIDQLWNIKKADADTKKKVSMLVGQYAQDGKAEYAKELARMWHDEEATLLDYIN